MRHAGPIGLLLVATASTAALAQDAPAPVRVGVVDLAAVVSGYTRTAALELELRSEREKVTAELEAASERMRVFGTGRRPPGEEASALRDRIRQQSYELEQLQERRQAELRGRFEAAIDQLLADVEAAVAEHARANRLGLVLRIDRVEPGAGPEGDLVRLLRTQLGPTRREVLFADATFDCTRAVLDRLNGTSRGVR